MGALIMQPGRLARQLGLVVLLALSQGSFAQQLIWHDGPITRRLWPVNGWVADFSGSQADPESVLRLAGTSGVGSTVSPVFRDCAQCDGPWRALPGGVVIRSSATTSSIDLADLARKHGIESPRPLGSGGRLWLIATPPGLAALELATRLHESGDFEAAWPNWWQPRMRR